MKVLFKNSCKLPYKCKNFGGNVNVNNRAIVEGTKYMLKNGNENNRCFIHLCTCALYICVPKLTVPKLFTYLSFGVV